MFTQLSRVVRTQCTYTVGKLTNMFKLQSLLAMEVVSITGCFLGVLTITIFIKWYIPIYKRKKRMEKLVAHVPGPFAFPFVGSIQFFFGSTPGNKVRNISSTVRDLRHRIRRDFNTQNTTINANNTN